MKRIAVLSLLAPALLLTFPAWASPAEKLGEDYAAASPGDKLALLAVALADNVLDRRETSAEVAAVARAEVRKGDTPEERLRLLGALRAAADEKLKEINAERREKKQRVASRQEPNNNLQLAVALAYIAATAGPKPTLDALGCLALVRESTSWGATNGLVLATAQEAFARDEEFMAADVDGKLSRIKVMSEDRAMLSDHERSRLENAVLAEWMSAELEGGASASAVADALKKLRDRKLVCFFSYNWANGILQGLDELDGEGS